MPLRVSYDVNSSSICLLLTHWSYFQSNNCLLWHMETSRQEKLKATSSGIQFITCEIARGNRFETRCSNPTDHTSSYYQKRRWWIVPLHGKKRTSFPGLVWDPHQSPSIQWQGMACLPTEIYLSHKISFQRRISSKKEYVKVTLSSLLIWMKILLVIFHVVSSCIVHLLAMMGFL